MQTDGGASTKASARHAAAAAAAASAEATAEVEALATKQHAALVEAQTALVLHVIAVLAKGWSSDHTASASVAVGGLDGDGAAAAGGGGGGGSGGAASTSKSTKKGGAAGGGAGSSAKAAAAAGVSDALSPDVGTGGAAKKVKTATGGAARAR